MFSLIAGMLLPAAACLARSLPLGARTSDPKGDCDTELGLIAPALGSRINVQVETPGTVPGKKSMAAWRVRGVLPGWSCPYRAPRGRRTVLDGAFRGIKLLREVVVEVGTIAVVEPKSNLDIKRNGSLKMLLYDTLARRDRDPK